MAQENIVKRIAYAVGYDITDVDAKDFINTLVDAGIEDIRRAGVDPLTIANNALVIPTLIMFVNDNLNLTAGSYKTSAMYRENVDALRGSNHES